MLTKVIAISIDNKTPSRIKEYLQYLKESANYRRGLKSIATNHVGESLLYMSFMINCSCLETFGLVVYSYFISNILERLFGSFFYAAFMPWRDSWDNDIRAQATKLDSDRFLLNDKKLSKHFFFSGVSDVAVAGLLLFANPMFFNFLGKLVFDKSTALLSLSAVTIYKFLQVIPKLYESASWYLLKNNFSLHPKEIRHQASIKNWGFINSVEQSIETVIFIGVTSLVNITMGLTHLANKEAFIILGVFGCFLMFGSKLAYLLSKNFGKDKS